MSKIQWQNEGRFSVKILKPARTNAEGGTKSMKFYCRHIKAVLLFEDASTRDKTNKIYKARIQQQTKNLKLQIVRRFSVAVTQTIMLFPVKCLNATVNIILPIKVWLGYLSKLCLLSAVAQ